MSENLTAKQRSFCRYFALTRNHREAAARAGYLLPERMGLKLLDNPAVQKEVNALDNRKTDISEAEKGFRRLAFGSISDAVRLMLCESTDSEGIEGLDLYCISEIKRPKGGGMEIKFFDRIKALEQLANLESSKATNSAESFYHALEAGADKLKDGDSFEH